MELLKLKSRFLDRLTDEEFFLFCQEQRDMRIERSSTGEIRFMSPTGSETGWLNQEINRQLANWNHQQRLGRVFDSSTGFTMPDGAVLSPDASWVSLEKWQALTLAEQRRFAPVCPEFVVELASPTDALDALLYKMGVWLTNGCQLAWLVFPPTETVHVFQPGHPARLVQGFNQTLSADPVLSGFSLDLRELLI